MSDDTCGTESPTGGEPCFKGTPCYGSHFNGTTSWPSAPAPSSVRRAVKAATAAAEVINRAPGSKTTGPPVVPSQGPVSARTHQERIAAQVLANAPRWPNGLTFEDGVTLGEVRAYLETNRREGTTCPGCSQPVKVYRRKVHKTLAQALVSLAMAGPPGSFHHAPSLPGDTHEISQLAWWGLVEEEDTRRPDGGRAGWWSVTPEGFDYLAGRLSIPTYAVIYNAQVVALEGDEVTIRAALGESFDLRVLMGS